MKPSLSLSTVAIYVFAFITPLFMMGVLSTFSIMSDLLVQRTPEPLEKPLSEEFSNPPQVNGKNQKTKVLFLTSNIGTQITDLLGPYEILATSEVFEVFTVAPERKLSPLTGSVSILPDFDFKTAPQADILVIPAVLDFSNPLMINWVKKQASQVKYILALCEGVRLAALAGLLENQKATSHFLVIQKLQEEFPEISFQKNSRFVASEKVLSSGGITASMDAALELVAKWSSEAIAQKTAKTLKFSPSPKDFPWSFHIGAKDFLRLFLNGGFDWNRKNIAVYLYSGVSEMGLASVLDTFPRTLSERAVTFAPERVPIRSAHGLTLIPTLSTPNLPKVDYVLVPPSGLKKHSDSELNFYQSITNQKDFFVKSFQHIPPGQSFQNSLEFLSKIEDRAITSIVSRLIEFPNPQISPEASSGPSAGLLIRPFLVGLLGVFLTWGFRRRLAAKKT